METHLYSKRKCLLFSCTICQRTFVCLFYYCLYNSFLFIEHSSMSVKPFFYLSERAKSFLYVKRTVFHVLGNREIQTNVNKQLLDKLIEIGKHQHQHLTHILSHLFQIWAQGFLEFKCLCSRCWSRNVQFVLWFSYSIFFVMVCRPFGLPTSFTLKQHFECSVKLWKYTGRWIYSTIIHFLHSIAVLVWNR